MVEKTCKIFPNKKMAIFIICIVVCSNIVGCAKNYKTESLVASHGDKINVGNLESEQVILIYIQFQRKYQLRMSKN